jgi:sugar phosphate isomerase/epimerase
LKSKPTLTLSTSWCSKRHNDGYAMLREVADLGFTHVELSHGTKITLVPGILRAVEEGVVRVGSTHNFCPLPAGVFQSAPNLFEPSSLDSREHDQWLRHTKRSIDFAAQVGARVVVCHLGSVKFFWFNPANALEHYLEKNPKTDAATDKVYQARLAKALAKLRKKMGPYWDQTKKTVAEVFDYATQKGVKLGLENREAFDELPVDADYAEWIASMPPTAPVGYWHDTGHADIKHHMGLLNHREHLEKNAPRLLGFHLHDVNAEGKDHQPVGSGRIDFKMISQFWKPEHLLVLEFSPRLTTEDVTLSKQRIEALM